MKAAKHLSIRLTLLTATALLVVISGLVAIVYKTMDWAFTNWLGRF
jgi:hypothetical protein